MAAAIDTYASTGLVVLGHEGLGAAATEDGGQLQHRPSHPDPPATGAGTGQGVAGTGLAGRADLLGPAPHRPANCTLASWRGDSNPRPAVYKTTADRLRRAGACCPGSSGRMGRPASTLLTG